jgi:hypothetical protein
MIVFRGVAVAAMLATLGVGAATPAVAAPVLRGHYIRETTKPGGNPVEFDWYFTPCGDGCTDVAHPAGAAPFGRARIINGQWNLDATSSANCPDGTAVPNALTDHYVWDPLTLQGTAQITGTLPACGEPAGHIEPVRTLRLTPAP